jgi:hypothetical protein
MIGIIHRVDIPDGGPPPVPLLLVALLLLVPLPLLVAAVPLPPPQGVAQFSVRHAPRAPSAALLEHEAGVVPWPRHAVP